MTFCNANKPKAQLSGNNLVLSLPDAMTPVVWMIDTKTSGSFFARIEEDANGLFILQKIEGTGKEIKIEDYQKLVYDPIWTGNTFMVKAMECVKEEKTLPSFFVIRGDEGIKTTPIPKVKTNDNETKKVIPEKSEDSKDELPSQKPKESEEDSTTIFQG